jgi:hypothetical protein
MTTLVSATFAANATGGIAITVKRHCRTLDGEPTWIVTAKDSTNVVWVQRFTSLRDAFGFTSETLAGYA